MPESAREMVFNCKLDITRAKLKDLQLEAFTGQISDPCYPDKVYEKLHLAKIRSSLAVDPKDPIRLITNVSINRCERNESTAAKEKQFRWGKTRQWDTESGTGNRDLLENACIRCKAVLAQRKHTLVRH
ncbi:hypothetical protein K0M31_015398 [Melipona bicolor]|uniref:Uncharacterized protein n=1 Tax=Melipona bicolor TaxID=60889 RepID=A0AA40FFP8_9HYME|nr:hypothetical protein K0M31_015398 [Melipona bicolor]